MIKVGDIVYRYGEEYEITVIDGDSVCIESDRLNDSIPYWEWWDLDDLIEYIEQNPIKG